MPPTNDSAQLVDISSIFQVQEMSQPPAPEDDGDGHDDGDPEPPEADQGYEAQFDDGFDLGEDYVGTEDNYPGYSVKLQFTVDI